MTRAMCVEARSEHQTARLFRLGAAACATSLAVFACGIASQARGDDAVNAVQAVDGLMAAGEFGAAADIAAQQPEAARGEMVKKIVDDRLQAGDVDGAKAVLPALGQSRDRVEATGQVARNQMTNGGANFSELIELIQTVTEGPWFDIDAEGGTMTPFTSGIKVDPNGVLARQAREESNHQVSHVRQQARAAHLNGDMAQPSALRLVSLTRLEKEVARRLAEGKPVVESMQNLAGLSHIQYVLLYPEQGEIVIGGPAEGWRYNEQGLPVGAVSQTPTLQLDDLVTVMRTFSPNGQTVFGCSIDPRQENLKAVKDFVADSQSRGALSPAGVRSWATKIGNLLGLQDITVFGVPGSSRVARVMVEADYRMKLIGIGKLDGGSQVPDYFELLAKNPGLASGNLDALRWWMTLQCEAVVHSPEKNAFEIRGAGVKCLSENQHLTASGERIATGKSEPVNQQFAANFTSHYEELAKKDPIFADLEGIFDLALVAAMIQNNQLDQRAGWDRGVFAANGEYRPASYATPKQTESVINHRVFNGQDVVLQVAGGVRGDAMAVLNDAAVNHESPRLGTVAQQAQAGELPANRWWWDAK
ncbi:DUF1598 domain-containing protein [Planctomicrobium piriforme]|uniref:DUF1598 domain-containing protein n=1 Tax=Planctomicrobium piriforme TaxID=1576369 RepID=A0A1I3C0M9_9PLAN|nr:DUF1598 domain-containing protein [Planctomicrobium piriforme]SFH68084.1 Protein of unknown function [Planctomicrobium piriforme]